MAQSTRGRRDRRSAAGDQHEPQQQALARGEECHRRRGPCVVVVVAGNSDLNSCDVSPACFMQALTICSCAIVVEKTSFSKWDACVGVLTSGQGILSTRILRLTCLPPGPFSFIIDSAPFYLHLHSPEQNPNCPAQQG